MNKTLHCQGTLYHGAWVDERCRLNGMYYNFHVPWVVVSFHKMIFKRVHQKNSLLFTLLPVNFVPSDG